MKKKSIFHSWPRFYHWLYHRLFGHRMTNEAEYFNWNRAKAIGFTGDEWCKYCSYKLYSREAKRMEYFGLMSVKIQGYKGEDSREVDEYEK